jgi:secondary thiamine-phosphate synthase enzyme
MQTTITVPTRGPGLYEFTDQARAFASGSDVKDGVMTLFVRHTSCSILIQENADPDVRRDLEAFFRRLAPHADDPSMGWIRHRTEGPDDMPAHIKAAVLPTSLSIPVADGRMTLGAWQGLYLFEHRDAPQDRKVVLHLTS